MQDIAISAKSLNKIYTNNKGSEHKHALKDVDLQIPKGSFFALLGPNGAGKSTFINILAGLVFKTSGSINVFDISLDKNPIGIKKHLGVVPQELNMDPFFTPKQLLDLHAGLFGVVKKDRRTEELLEMVSLQDKANAYTRSLSGGMMRRLLFAKAMVHNPDIIILDEPTAGVDVELRHMLWEQMQKLNRMGKTIILTTHYLEEAQELCEHIAIINKGKVIISEKKEKLINNLGNRSIIINFKSDVSEIPTGLQDFYPQQEASNVWRFSYAGGDNISGYIVHFLIENGLEINSINTEEARLEDIFINLTSDKC